MSRVTGLKTGLIVLVVTAIVIVGFLIRTPLPEQTDAIPEQSARTEIDPATEAYLYRLDRVVPEIGTATRDALNRALNDPNGSAEFTSIVINSLFRAMQETAIDLRYASVFDYGHMMSKFGNGMMTLRRVESEWCEGAYIADFLRQNEEDLIPTLAEALGSNDKAYEWTVQWGALYLDAAAQGQDVVFEHLPRTAADKRILQDVGRGLGSEQWQVALAIGAFGQAEGQGYDEMQTMIRGANVCDLGIAMVQLSNRLPRDTRGRILSELLPELFSGNTPYVMALVTDYFYITNG